MAWETIKNGGALLVSAPGSNNVEGASTAGEFLEQFSRAFVRVCAKYQGEVGVLPIGDERQTHSAVLPAMYQVARAVYMELPMPKRKQGPQKKTAAGWVDYWANFEDYVFLIELKVSWLNLNRSVRVPEGTRNAWSRALQQLKQVQKADAEFQAIYPGKALKIALMIVPGYQWAYDEQELPPFNEAELGEVHETLLAGLPDPAADWHCIWRPHEKLMLYQYPEDQGWESMPYLGIVAKILPV